MKLLGYDADGITVGIIPRPCAACGIHIDRLYLYLEVDAEISVDGVFQAGASSVGQAPCCGDTRPARIASWYLAEAIEHVNNCPNHPAQAPPREPSFRLCRHPNAVYQALGNAWRATCPDCPAVSVAPHARPELPPWALPET